MTLDMAEATGTAYSDEAVRVVTWNVQHANVNRTLRQIAWLTETIHTADAIVLTEVAAGATGDVWAQALELLDYTVILPIPGNDDPYRVLVACRGATEQVDIGVTVQPHRCVAARVTTPNTRFGILGLYVPSRGPRERRNVAKRAFQAAVSAALPDLDAQLVSGGTNIVVGDLNVVEPDHVPRYPVFGHWEYEFYSSFAKNGFVDAFRVVHPEGMDYSWFGRPTGTNIRATGMASNWPPTRPMTAQ